MMLQEDYICLNANCFYKERISLLFVNIRLYVRILLTFPYFVSIFSSFFPYCNCLLQIAIQFLNHLAHSNRASPTIVIDNHQE